MPLSAERFDRLDALRGLAIVWMVGFHFAFDLNHLGWLQPRQNFLRRPAVDHPAHADRQLFLLCAGAGQAVALQAGLAGHASWRRWAQVACCAVLVSLGSMLMFPRSWISFGVLHGMALMLVAGRLLAPLRAGLWPLGAALVALPQWVAHPFFDSRLTNWVGLVTRKPVTEDFVPLLPWLGVMLWGPGRGPVAVGPPPRSAGRPVAGRAGRPGPGPGLAGALAALHLHAAPAAADRRAHGPELAARLSRARQVLRLQCALRAWESFAHARSSPQNAPARRCKCSP
jgi:uncharacterized membrane protein